MPVICHLSLLFLLFNACKSPSFTATIFLAFCFQKDEPEKKIVYLVVHNVYEFQKIFVFISQFTSGSLSVHDLITLTIRKDHWLLLFKGIMHLACDAHYRGLKFWESNCQGFARFQSSIHNISNENSPEYKNNLEINLSHVFIFCNTNRTCTI